MKLTLDNTLIPRLIIGLFLGAILGWFLTGCTMGSERVDNLISQCIKDGGKPRECLCTFRTNECHRDIVVWPESNIQVEPK